MPKYHATYSGGRKVYEVIDGVVTIDERDHSHSYGSAPFVLGDQPAYQSMADGSMVEGRVAHREHLKRHNLVEIGDAYDKKLPKPKAYTPAPGLREAIARQVYQKL